MNKGLNAKISSILAALVLIIAIFALMLLNGSAAWFADNAQTDARGFNVKVKTKTPASVMLKSYPIDEIDEAAGVYTLYRGEESYELPTDDPNGISYSKYKKALAVIITLEAQSDATFFVLLKASSGVETVTSPSLSNYISNCMSISMAELSDDGLVATKTELGFEKSFVDVSATPVEKSGQITLIENVTVPAGETKEICFIMEYNAELLDYIGNKILEQHLNDNKIMYYNDIEFQIHG